VELRPGGAGSRLEGMSELEAMAGDVEDAIERICVPAYMIDAHGIIRWLNPAARKLVGDVRGRQLTSVVAPEETRRARRSSPGTSSRHRRLGQQGRGHRRGGRAGVDRAE
jgi:hypothetical protein